jgi:cell division protein FtsB
MGLAIHPDPGYKDSLKAFIRTLSRRGGYLLIVMMGGMYGWVALRGPQGIHALLEKRHEIRQLQEQNASAARENERRREHIRRLEQSQSEQEMEIRKQLKLLRPGETTFILPEPAKPVEP